MKQTGVKFVDKYAQAITTYVNSLPKNASNHVQHAIVKNALDSSHGNFLSLCAVLADQNQLDMTDVDEIDGLCNAILRTDTKKDGPIPVSQGQTTEKSALADSHTPEKHNKNTRPSYEDPMDEMTGWPSKAGRENVPGARTCVLKGIARDSSLHQLQAMVWGGPLEKIAIPEPGQAHTMVKFMTVEGCSKFAKDTRRGILLPGGQNKMIFVELVPGPNSVNDALQAFIDHGITRCIRAVDADDDWGTVALNRLALGTDKVKRDIDIIKQGKTDKGRHYIEFRFGNVYHAVSFKKQLEAQIDWEHCMVQFAPDPCAIATGLHTQD
ncbi:hypothetical protein B0J11DRAFT_444737 [Dendryphion nanum]|uniref:Uncharacterized protein n=1 Tax=Dendryphion nanum TaxID=256645 RepID=A0A9P9D9Z5_9PLEO|nr:hypothetical protein B0J11DRAFT_444737 [Dendryphion nanum]